MILILYPIHNLFNLFLSVYYFIGHKLEAAHAKEKEAEVTNPLQAATDLLALNESGTYNNSMLLHLFLFAHTL